VFHLYTEEKNRDKTDMTIFYNVVANFFMC